MWLFIEWPKYLKYKQNERIKVYSPVQCMEDPHILTLPEAVLASLVTSRDEKNEHAPYEDPFCMQHFNICAKAPGVLYLAELAVIDIELKR